MILYRIIENKNFGISNPKKSKFYLNTFDYDENVDYLHFFILPENVDALQSGKFLFNKESIILRCDISIELLEFGIGLYTWYYRNKFVPFLEVRIKKSDFQNSFIKETSSYIKDEWKNIEIFKRYLVNCIYNQNAFTYTNTKKTKLTINPDFNFFDYFNKSDLENEHLNTANYPEDISFTALKKQKLSFIKRTLINFKEAFEMINDCDPNFYNIDYIEKIKYQKKL